MSIAVIEIDRKAILHNIAYFKKIAPNSQLIAIIKANAYSHGMCNVAKLIEAQVDGFGVARLAEAIELREQGIHKPILLLEGFFPHDDLGCLIDYNLQAVIHSSWQIDLLKKLPLIDVLTVWFKIDTGMHRLGFDIDEAKTELLRLAHCQIVCKPINLLSHFSCADELTSSVTMNQLNLFNNFIDSIEDKSIIGLTSIAASGGAIAWPKAHLDAIRPGIGLYGVSPFMESIADLIPAMTFKSELIAIRKHRKGQAVGYGQIWTSEQDTLLGLVAMGYGDGYPRHIPANTPVLINGRKVPIVGRVSMDMLVIDLGSQSQDRLGDDVILWGKGLPVEEIAKHTGISAYQLITCLTHRNKIHYIN